MTPSRSPSRADRLTPERAWMRTAGFSVRCWYHSRTTYSLSVTRLNGRTVKVRLTSVRSILAIAEVLAVRARVWASPERKRREEATPVAHAPGSPAHTPGSPGGHRWKITRF